jgi:hypothetical protein
MRSVRAAAAAASIFLSAGAQAGAPFTCRFLGTGRACYGSLAVQTKTVSWLTSFSRCQALPVDLIEQDGVGGSLRRTYRFTRVSPSCRFEVLSLTHDGSKPQDIAWQVVGYPTEASFLRDKAEGFSTNVPDIMMCNLIRDPGKKGRSDR